MIHAPARPETADGLGSARFELRFEDLSQDGRLRLDALPTALGRAVWQSLTERRDAMKAWLRDGILPILTRYAIDAAPGPFALESPLEVSGCFQLAHTQSADGAVDRLMLLMWADAFAPIARMYGPKPERAGERTRAGSIFAEYVFTRPFAPPEARRVTRFEVPGVPPVPEPVYASSPHAEILVPSRDAVLLDEAWVLDPAPLAMGLTHTDSNQHVNSLVYMRLFEEAALRRFVAHGRDAAVLAREVEVAYRKPTFAGQSVRVVLRAFAQGDRVGAVGAIVAEGDASSAESAARARPHATLCMMFEG